MKDARAVTEFLSRNECFDHEIDLSFLFVKSVTDSRNRIPRPTSQLV